jgi:hypothetical protein
MKLGQARPWMLANLKIIWQFHAHPVHQKVSRFVGPRYIVDDIFLGPTLVSFNRTVNPYEISITETRNPCVIKFILLACFTYIDIFLIY